MNENEFGFRIRQALDEGLDRLDYSTLHRLRQARETALARQHSLERGWAPALRTNSGPTIGETPFGWVRWFGLAVPLLALVVGFVGIYDYQESRRIAELANIDFAVLMDDVPVETYADKGFGALLKAPAEEL